MSEAKETVLNIEDAMNAQETEHEVMQQLLTFTVNHDEYAIDIMCVKEIRGWNGATRLPNSPEFVLGVVNLRGIIIPIFDLKLRFNKGSTKATSNHVVVIVNVNQYTIGILVDAVSDILYVNEKNIRPAPSGEKNIDEAFVNGLLSKEEQVVVILDLIALFDEKVLKSAIKFDNDRT